VHENQFLNNVNNVGARLYFWQYDGV